MAKGHGRDGRWIAVGTVGEGGQAHVLRVRDRTGALPGELALKRLKNIKRMDLFRREVEATTSLGHPHILKVIDFDVEGSEPYYVAECCEGGNLVQRSAQLRGNVRDSVNILLAIVDAVHAAHERKIVHRDIKPPNILFRADGSAVLGDFGICHMEGDDRVTLSDEAMGSTNYVAPEMQAGQHGPVTGAVDVYALGKTLYWMVSGGKIFAREDHRAPNLYLPRLLGDQRWEHVHALLDGMVVESPAARIPIALLPTRLQQMLALVEGDYMPLRPSIGLRCRLCGIGTYRQHAQTTNVPVAASWFNQIGRMAGSDLRILRCNHCGHVEWFDFHGIEDAEWWDR